MAEIPEQVHSIILGIYQDCALLELLSKLEPADLREDLFHHFIERCYLIAERYPGKLEELAACDRNYCHIVNAAEPHKRELTAWCIGGIKRELMSSRSPFARKYRKRYEPLEVIGRNVPDEIEEKRNPIETYNRLVEKGGNGFAAGVWAEIERQEKIRVRDFGKPPKQNKAMQIELW